MNLLSQCPAQLPSEIDNLLRDCARVWAKHALRPRIDCRVADHWDQVIFVWSNNDHLPLLIRKEERGVACGEVIIHDSGRQLVPTDNSPAWWSYHRAFCGDLPTLADIRQALEEDRIPVAMIADREMTARAQYKCMGTANESPNSLGWKVCHKRKIALAGRGSIRHRDLADLQTHFREFLSPSNMFLVPKTLAGLGELPHLIEAINGEPNGL